jgi:hypothetical protein
MRRAGQGFSVTNLDHIANRRQFTTAAAAIGSVLLACGLATSVWEGIAGPRSAGGPLAAIVGALFGAAVVVILEQVVRWQRVSWIPLPKALGTDLPGAGSQPLAMPYPKLLASVREFCAGWRDEMLADRDRWRRDSMPQSAAWRNDRVRQLVWFALRHPNRYRLEERPPNSP